MHPAHQEYRDIQVNPISPLVQQVLLDLKELKVLAMSKVFKELQVQLVTSPDPKGLKETLVVVESHHKDLKAHKELEGVKVLKGQKDHKGPKERKVPHQIND